MEIEGAASGSVSTLPKDDVVLPTADARATLKHEDQSKSNDYNAEIPPKKRKTRRGKCKRRNVHPYKNELKTNKVHKPEAPYNSNRFLIEDHGNIDEIDEELRNTDQISTSTVTRTRDSSFSIDSEGEFYSTPDDEEEFLIKDFDDQYESLQAERLQSMSKNELIQEYLQLESRVESLTKRLRNRSDEKINNGQQNVDLQKEIERLKIENETLKRENETLKNKIRSSSCTSDSEDSETDSSDSCSSTSSSSSRPTTSPIVVDCSQTNGHSPAIIEETI